MKHLLPLTLSLLPLLLIAQNAPPRITNLGATITGTTMTIRYDLTDAEGDPVTMSLRAGPAGTTTFPYATTAVAGAVGADITPGTDKTITWDFTDYADQAPDFRIMLVADDGQPVDIQAIVDQVDQQRVEAYLNQVEGVRHFAENPEQWRAARALLTDEFTAAGLDVSSRSVLWNGNEGANIIGRHLGVGAAAEYLILDGHYDTVDESPGADDNGSAVAGVLEAARILSGYATERSVEFVGFDFEEVGLVGSQAYVDGADDLSGLRGVINLEMIGYASSEPNSQSFPPGFAQVFPEQIAAITANELRGDFISVVADGGSTGLSAAFSAAAGQYVPSLSTVVLDIPVASTLVPDLRRSDHAPFWDAGVPALMITDGAEFRNPNYHTPNDVASTLDFAFMTDVVRASVATLAELAGVQHATTAWLDTDETVGAGQAVESCTPSLWPNPAEERIVVNLGECGTGSGVLQLVGSDGKVHFRQEHAGNSPSLTVEVADLAAGVYFLTFRGDEGRFRRRVVVR